MKKTICLILVLCMLLSLTGCKKLLGSAAFLTLVLTGDNRADKDAVCTFVREHEAELLAAVQAGDYSAFENHSLIHEINTENEVVDFFCGGFGVGSGTSYVGFYYTPNNDMTAVWCAPASPSSLLPSGDGFAWREENGDNRYYSEKICECFYYYEASF